MSCYYLERPKIKIRMKKGYITTDITAKVLAYDAGSHYKYLIDISHKPTNFISKLICGIRNTTNITQQAFLCYKEDDITKIFTAHKFAHCENLLNRI